MTANEIVLYVRKMEKEIVKHPEVEDAVVVGDRQPRGGYVLKAFVEPASNDSVTINSIKKYCLTQFGALPVEVIFRKIPRTPSGKIARQQLLQMA